MRAAERWPCRRGRWRWSWYLTGQLAVDEWALKAIDRAETSAIRARYEQLEPEAARGCH